MSDFCVKHIESYWKEVTYLSDDYYCKGEYSEALEGYLDAFYRAEILSVNFIDCIRTRVPFIQIYLTSCNNLKKVYKINGMEEELAELEATIKEGMFRVFGNVKVV